MTSVGYFGKIPSRGDFVKGSDNPALITVLDDWLAFAMDLMSNDTRWKLHYDADQPLHFAFLGPRRRQAIAGYILASRDQSQRRFPFLMMSTMQVPEAGAFVRHAPLLLGRLWNQLEALTGRVMAADDPGPALRAAASHVVDLDLASPACASAFAEFLEQSSIGTLDALLMQAGFAGPVRQLLLALGLLLRPVLRCGSRTLDKSLLLPLPDDILYRNLVATFWMHLITPFLASGNVELALFITRINAKPVLVLGFDGASAATLSAIMDPAAAASRHITFDQLDWVDQQLHADAALARLAACLAEPDLPLAATLAALHSAFTGA